MQRGWHAATGRVSVGAFFPTSSKHTHTVTVRRGKICFGINPTLNPSKHTLNSKHSLPLFNPRQQSWKATDSVVCRTLSERAPTSVTSTVRRQRTRAVELASTVWHCGSKTAALLAARPLSANGLGRTVADRAPFISSLERSGLGTRERERETLMLVNYWIKIQIVDIRYQDCNYIYFNVFHLKMRQFPWSNIRISTLIQYCVLSQNTFQKSINVDEI